MTPPIDSLAIGDPKHDIERAWDKLFDELYLRTYAQLADWGDEGDRQAIREFRRVLRPGGTLVIETMHRDRLMAIYSPRSWNELPEGGLLIEEREIDYERGLSVVRHELVQPDGTRIG